MASQGRRNGIALTEQLFEQGYRFDFFQAVRVLEWIGRQRAERSSRCESETTGGERRAPDASRDQQRHAVGRDRNPNREAVRFRALPALSFPAGEISRLRRWSDAASGDDLQGPPEMTVGFMGLIGPSGVLPQHYTKMVIQRTRDKDFGLRDFLDLFNHRAISLFYRAWEKQRFALGYERSQADRAREEDLFTRCLYCLLGLGTSGLRGRMLVDDEALLFFAGLFSHQPRCAVALERMLCDYFNLAFQVKQFQGQWLQLSDEDRSLLPSRRRPQGQNARVGRGLVVGERVWDVQCRFRLRVGTLRYAQFLRMMPSGDVLRSLCELTRFYVGPELDFDVQPVLSGEEVPWCRLGAPGDDAPRLGWNTWVRCEPFAGDVDDPVFSLEDV